MEPLQSMPRRPRPASRAPPKSVRKKQANATEKSNIHPKRKFTADLESEGNLESDFEENEVASNWDGIIEKDAESYENEDGTVEEEEDADTPRVAQWVDEDELGGSVNESNSEDQDQEMPKMNLVR
jgi:ribosomal RNA-processing protein 36